MKKLLLDVFLGIALLNIDIAELNIPLMLYRAEINYVAYVHFDPCNTNV